MEEKIKIALNEMGEGVQLETVRKDGFAIEYIKNPSKEVQLTAVREDGYAIRYIDNPSEEVQLEAIRKDGYAIQFIDNPSEQVQLEAIRQNGLAIEFIDNPTEQVQLEAARQDGFAIECIKNPSDYIKSIIDVVDTSKRRVYVLHEPNKEPLFSIGCQCNITKEYFIERIYNLDGGLEEHPYRQEYLDILERY